MFKKRTARLVQLPPAPPFLNDDADMIASAGKSFLVHYVVRTGPPSPATTIILGRRKLRSDLGYESTYGASRSRQYMSPQANPRLSWLNGLPYYAASHFWTSNSSPISLLRPVCDCQQLTPCWEPLLTLGWQTMDAHLPRLTFGCWCDMSPSSHQIRCRASIGQSKKLFQK